MKSLSSGSLVVTWERTNAAKYTQLLVANAPRNIKREWVFSPSKYSPDLYTHAVQENFRNLHQTLLHSFSNYSLGSAITLLWLLSADANWTLSTELPILGTWQTLQDKICRVRFMFQHWHLDCDKRCTSPGYDRMLCVKLHCSNTTFTCPAKH